MTTPAPEIDYDTWHDEVAHVHQLFVDAHLDDEGEIVMPDDEIREVETCLARAAEILGRYS